MAITLDQVTKVSLSSLMQLPVADLHRLYQSMLLALGHAQAQKSVLENIIHRKYHLMAEDQLLHEGKDTGTVHLTDDRFDVRVNIPKKVIWDQTQLKQMARQLRDQGVDPEIYIDCSLKVSEKTYNGLPLTLKPEFQAARTVKPGKAHFTLTPLH